MTLWLEKPLKRKISKLADEQKISQSVLVERLVEAAWAQREESK